MSHDDNKLYDLIYKLYEKIEVLENKIDRISINPSEISISQVRTLKDLTPEPSANLDDWLDTIQISDDCIMLVTSSIINAFQTAVKQLLLDSNSPIYKHKNKLYLFDKTNTWVQLNEENLSTFICGVWRKFIKAHIVMKYSDEELYFAQRKSIMEMRIKLFEVKRTRNELCVWLKHIVKN